MKRIFSYGLMMLALLSGCAILSPLDEAISQNDVAQVKELLAQGTPPDNTNALGGGTPLMVASSDGNSEIVKTLLAYGANPAAKDQWGSSALEMAISSGCSECAIALIESGIDVNYIEPINGYTPLGLAIIFANWPVFESLLKHGARVDLLPKFGSSYLMLLSNGSSSSDDKNQNENRIKIARKLLELGERIDWGGPKSQGYSPLISAAGMGNAELVRFFIEQGADVNKVSNDGQTARSLAIQLNHPEIAQQIDSDQAQLAQLKKQQAQDELAKRIEAQKCKQFEPNWFWLDGHCKQGVADGAGEAESSNRLMRVKSNFKKGYFNHGQLFALQDQKWNLIYEGGFEAGELHGNGICGAQKEPCVWDHGKRIDATYLARQKQQADQQEAERRRNLAQAQLTNLKIAQQEEEERLANVAACQRQAQQEADEDTIARCDDQGNIYVENKSDEIMASQQAMYKTFVDVTDALVANANQAQAQATSSYNTSEASTNNQPDPAARLQELQRQIQDAQQRLQAEQQAVAQNQTDIGSNTSSSTRVDVTESRPVQPVQWDSAMPEALAVCWHNDQSYWFCDGPLQTTQVGEKDLNSVRQLVGCRTSNSEIHEIGSTGRYRVFGCGRGLQSGERDMRPLHGVSGGNQYRCLKKDNDAGKICTQLSDQ